MLDAPSFPTFRRIKLDDIGWYNEYYRRFEPYADFSFGNLIIWLDQANDLEISQLNGNVVLKCTSLFMGDKLMLTFLGNHKVEQTIQQLFDYQSMHHMNRELLGIPGAIIEQLPKEQAPFEIIDDRDNYEYVLDASQLAALDGSKFRKIRQQVRIFLRSYGDEVLIKELDLQLPENRQFLLEALPKWGKAFSTNDTAQQEEAVIKRTLKYAVELHYGNLSLFVDGELAGFILYQQTPQKDFVIVNHAKSSYKHDFTFDFLIYALANRLIARGVKYINFEQDLGIPGLRGHKESLRPIYFLKKYVLKPRAS